MANDHYQFIHSYTKYLLDLKTLKTSKGEVNLMQALIKTDRVSLLKKGVTLVDCPLPNNQLIGTSQKLFSQFKKITDVNGQLIDLPKNMDAGNLQGHFFEQVSGSFFVDMLNLMGYAKDRPKVETSQATKAKLGKGKPYLLNQTDIDLQAGKNAADVKSEIPGKINDEFLLRSKFLQEGVEKCGDDFVGVKFESKGMILIQKATSKLPYFTDVFLASQAEKLGLDYIVRVYLDQEDFYVVENLHLRAIENSNSDGWN